MDRSSGIDLNRGSFGSLDQFLGTLERSSRPGSVDGLRHFTQANQGRPTSFNMNSTGRASIDSDTLQAALSDPFFAGQLAAVQPQATNSALEGDRASLDALANLLNASASSADMTSMITDAAASAGVASGIADGAGGAGGAGLVDMSDADMVKMQQAAAAAVAMQQQQSGQKQGSGGDDDASDSDGKQRCVDDVTGGGKPDRLGRRRASHKKVEQRRREKARNCFDELKRMIPAHYDVKPDKNSILLSTIDYMRELHATIASNSAGGAQSGGAAAMAAGGGIPIKSEDGTIATEATPIDYAASFHLSKQAMAYAGIDSRFWDVNEAFSSLVGYPPAELKAMTFMVLTLQEDLELFLSHARQLLCGDQPSVSFTCRWTRADGRVIACLVDMHMVLHSGNPSCFVLYTRQM